MRAIASILLTGVACAQEDLSVRSRSVHAFVDNRTERDEVAAVSNLSCFSGPAAGGGAAISSARRAPLRCLQKPPAMARWEHIFMTALLRACSRRLTLETQCAFVIESVYGYIVKERDRDSFERITRCTRRAGTSRRK